MDVYGGTNGQAGFPDESWILAGAGPDLSPPGTGPEPAHREAAEYQSPDPAEYGPHEPEALLTGTEQAGETEAPLTSTEQADRPGPDAVGRPARLVLGMAVLAAERVGSPTSGAFAIGVGLAEQTASGLRGLANRAVFRPSRVASRGVEVAARLSGRPGPLAKRRAQLKRLVEVARERGQIAMAAGRAEATVFLRESVSDGMTWAEHEAVPQVVDGLVPHLVESVVPKVVDGLVPHLVESVVPQVIEGVMPELRARVLPVLIDDLTHDPRLRDLVLEQSRGVVGDAAQQLRSATASADNRVEQAFRRLVGGESGRQASAEPGQDG